MHFFEKTVGVAQQKIFEVNKRDNRGDKDLSSQDEIEISEIIKTENNKDWTNNNKIKGLVHHIALLNNNVWFSGTRNSHFKETGIIQTKDQNQLLLTKTGCLWRMNTVIGNIISVTANSKLIMFDKTTNEINQIDTSPFAFYNIEKISESKILVVGHGKSICIIDFNE